ncbi:MAG: hypothetical protein ABIQ61_09800 [Ornithinibacter sp.]
MNVRTKMGMGVATAVALTLPGMGSASAAQGYQQLNCTDGSSILVRVPDSHSNDNGGWSVGQIVEGGSGHLIPTSFTFTLFDVTTDATIFSGEQLKGGGHANRNQTSVTCSNVESGTAGDFFGPDLPPGVSASDSITLTLTVGAVSKT